MGAPSGGEVLACGVVAAERDGQPAEAELHGPAGGDAGRRRELRAMRQQAIVEISRVPVGADPQRDVGAAGQAERARPVEREREALGGDGIQQPPGGLQLAGLGVDEAARELQHREIGALGQLGVQRFA